MQVGSLEAFARMYEYLHNLCWVIMKKVVWRGSRRSRIKDFPPETQDIAGHELMKIQLGKAPADWRRMASIGPGAIEIRVHVPHEHRVIYIANYPEAIYVLHCFGKKTKHTSKKDIDIARVEHVDLQKYRQDQDKQART
jgi:phage-related protein